MHARNQTDIHNAMLVRKPIHPFIQIVVGFT